MAQHDVNKAYVHMGDGSALVFTRGGFIGHTKLRHVSGGVAVRGSTTPEKKKRNKKGKKSTTATRKNVRGKKKSPSRSSPSAVKYVTVTPSRFLQLLSSH
jgi:hypothetical protein